MKDVAEQAGVGIKTVSRVVNGEPGVTPETMARVLTAIQDLGFRRNDSARTLRTGRTGAIALLVEQVADPFSSALTGAAEEVASRHGTLLLTGSCRDDPHRERELALAFCARRVDGIIVVPAAADHSYLAPEMAAGLAAVFVDRPPVDLEADSVLADNAGGARRGVEHLLAGGHRRIGFLGDSETFYTAAERLRGYHEAVAGAGLTVDPRLVEMDALKPGRIDLALARLLDGPAPATALFTGNNRLTVEVLRRITGRPGRPALVGFDDFELADLLTPGVTVIAQDPAGLGHTAAELLFSRLAGDASAPHRIVLPTRLIPRGSGEAGPAHR
ncbi:LacI family DNA-binding transcriptional regulator [Catenulispora subtropica]|uniref:LacI family DNA-binding transcriptional regulator n=1 Tax=Catenulispora subtropica TaxID=450798 RepID=A0ABP5EUH2_9ACTN